MLKHPNKYEVGKTIVYFVRHGERIHIPSTPGTGLLIPGPGLTKKGKEQAKKVAKELSKIKNEIDILYCSEMTRAIETANEISKKINKKPIIIAGISEFDGILWAKKIFTLKFWINYFKQRNALKTFDTLLIKNKHKVIVIVAHGNIIKSLIFRKMGLSLRKVRFFHHDNCYISVARYIGKTLEHVCCYNSNTVKHSGVPEDF